MLDSVTLWVFLAFWPVWLTWELILIVRNEVEVKSASHGALLLSQIARQRGWQFNSVVYCWLGLGAHFWWNGPDVVSPDWLGTVLFWLIAVALVATDAYRKYIGFYDWIAQPWYRRPLLWAVIGIGAGRVLFPQLALPLP
jgi:hypothetical protein